MGHSTQCYTSWTKLQLIERDLDQQVLLVYQAVEGHSLRYDSCSLRYDSCSLRYDSCSPRTQEGRRPDTNRPAAALQHPHPGVISEWKPHSFCDSWGGSDLKKSVTIYGDDALLSKLPHL
jgi:hypothetical protein